MMARQRQGPYLPGVRSRLWRLIPAAAGSITAAEMADAPEEPAATSATAPVLAMLSRLPLDEDDLIRSRGAGAYPAWRAAAMNRRMPGPLAVQQHARSRRSGPSPSATTAIVTSRIPTDTATSHGWTLLTISRASIANGLNGGTNDATRPDEPAAAQQHDQRGEIAGHRDEAQRQRQRLQVVRPAHERPDGRVDRRRTA